MMRMTTVLIFGSIAPCVMATDCVMVDVPIVRAADLQARLSGLAEVPMDRVTFRRLQSERNAGCPYVMFKPSVCNRLKDPSVLSVHLIGLTRRRCASPWPLLLARMQPWFLSLTTAVIRSPGEYSIFLEAD